MMTMMMIETTAMINTNIFQRATWAVLFLMRFRKHGHIQWPLESTVRKENNTVKKQKLPAIKETTSVQPDSTATAECTVIVRRWIVPKEQTRKTEIEVVNITPPKTIDRPKDLNEIHPQEETSVNFYTFSPFLFI